MQRSIGLFFFVCGFYLFIKFSNFNFNTSESSTIALGFTITTAYLVGQLFKKISLPQITGYIFAGLLFGPNVLQFIANKNLLDLNFINHMALSLIAFYAGGELKLSHLKEIQKSLLIIIAWQILIILGIFLILFFAQPFFSIFQQKTTIQVVCMAMLLGVVCVARSPSTAIAIITEAKSQGRVTDIVLGVTIALDVLVILLFAVVISLCEVLLIPTRSWNLNFLFVLISEIVISLIVGLLMGWALSLYINYVKAVLPIVLLTIGFLVTKFSYYLTDYLEHIHGIGLKIEPLLICIAAGFFIQNFSQHGSRFMISLDKVSLIIYTLFFSITGASLNLNVLKNNLMMALIIFFIRVIMIACGTITGATLARDPIPARYLYWLGFIAQAGVSLGFAFEITRRFPGWGNELACIIIAVVSINQLVGPITFKYALEKSKETRRNISYRTLVRTK